METILIAGGSGIIGTYLTEILRNRGYEVYILTRNKDKASKQKHFLHWDIDKGYIDEFDRADHIVNLAGSGIAEGKWTKSRKKDILDSRIQSSELLIKTIEERQLTIKSYVSASAIGFYGDGGEQYLTEGDSVVTKEFLSDVCVAWEQAALGAKGLVDHLSIIRIGTVLSPKGGALEKMAQTIPLGVANYLGHGRQLISWIHLHDVSEIIVHAIEKDLTGIYNAVAPEVLTNKDFTKQLKDAINSKALLLPAPAFGIKLVFGEMARVVLNSSNISSEKIRQTGFSFEYPSLEKALGQLYPT